MVRFSTLTAVAFWLASCSSPDPYSAPNATPDTLHIVASRLFESRTYEGFLEPLASPDAIQWHHASELTEEELSSALETAHGVLMTGGADIHPSRYGQAADTARCGAIDLDRDRIESVLLCAVDSLRLPCLGICRGLQFMNVHNRGTLYAHLPDVLGTDAHRAGLEGNSRDTLHAVIAGSNAEFIGIENETTSEVISHHHQGINRLGSGLEAWAYSPDGLIEGIRRSDSVEFPFYVGVQWHPERSPKNQRLVEPIGLHFLEALRQK